MTTDGALELLRQTIMHSLMLVSPILITAVVVGLVVSLLQAVTSLQEQTLSFVPKLFAVGFIMVLSAGWMLRLLMDFTIELMHRLPQLTH